jgi:hypothetical protein
MDADICAMSATEDTSVVFTYCSLFLLSLNVFRHSSSGTFACGLEVINGRKPPVSLFVGTCSHWS